MLRTALVLGLVVALVLAACAKPRADACRVEIEGPEEMRVEPGDVRASYRVKGQAGSPGKVWLAAKSGS